MKMSSRFTCTLTNLPTDKIVVPCQERGIIKLFAPYNQLIKRKTIYTFLFNNCTYQMSDDTVGVVFVPRKEVEHSLTGYYPTGTFLLQGKHILQITLIADKEDVIVKQGQYLCAIKLMSKKFFELWKKGDGSDTGLRSQEIQIIF